MQVQVCVDIHQSVAVASKQFLAELSRHNYVTPTSYLELLGTFGKLIQLKKNEVSTQRNRTKTGLDKVHTHTHTQTLSHTLSLYYTLHTLFTFLSPMDIICSCTCTHASILWILKVKCHNSYYTYE